MADDPERSEHAEAGRRQRPPTPGGLLVLTGYEIERLGYLAALLSETLPKALWAPAPAQDDAQGAMRLVRSHLAAGTTVVQLAEADQLGPFQDLAECAGARFLHVLSAPRAEADPPVGPGSNCPSARPVLAAASASLMTQLEEVLAAWTRLRASP